MVPAQPSARRDLQRHDRGQHEEGANQRRPSPPQGQAPRAGGSEEAKPEDPEHRGAREKRHAQRDEHRM